MILIADSGSSKTDWVLFNGSESEKFFETKGINPFFSSEEDITSLLRDNFSAFANSVSQVFFYGAGCIKGQSDVLLVEALQNFFTSATVDVNDDMLGAARSLFAGRAGIACILGTGANSCRYDGKQIVDKVPTLGYILGDEGSGAYLGKLFLNDFFKRKMPGSIQQLVLKELSLEWPQVLQAVYKGEYPSRYLATFSKFIFKYQDRKYFRDLAFRSMSDFYERNLQAYALTEGDAVAFVGSIAYYFAPVLEELASEKGFRLGEILKQPIDGLLNYHRQCAGYGI